MPNQVFKESFVGKYDGVTNPTQLAPGSLSGGENVRKVSAGGGWKPRKGCVLNNTTAIAAAPVKALFQYTNPRSGDYHLIAQCNSLLYDATNDPPAAGTTFGTSLGVTAGTTAGFADVVGESWFYADGTSRPIVWSGDTPYPIGFYVYDISELAYVDYTREIIDGRTDTEGTILGAATDVFYIITSEPCKGFAIDLGASVNSNAVTMAVKAWRAWDWAAVSALSDGTLDTATSTKTLAKDGTVTWTASASDTMRVIGNTMGYAYQVSWSGALSGSVTVRGLTVQMNAGLMTNKWNGAWDWVTGCRFYDQSVPEYQENLGNVTNESTSQYLDISAMQTADFIYVKTPEPAAGFGFGVVTGYSNTNSAEVDNVDYWNGSAWTTISTGIIDTTLKSAADTSFSQTGSVMFNAAAITPIRRTFEGDDFPGYWYRLSCNAALSADVRLFSIFYAAFPKALPAVKGCIEFKGRLFTWGDPEYPNKLRYSAEGRPDCFSGTDSGYTKPFGGMDEIICVRRFYNELIVWKKTDIYLLEGYSPATFGSLKVADTLGLASPQTARVVEVGFPSMNQDEPLSIVIWQDTDGVYVLDGRKPKKVSPAIDNYFDPEYSTCIAAASISTLGSFTDRLKNEYHLLLPDAELVYNYLLDEWYPPWNREVSLTCGLSLKGTDNRDYTYGGSSLGLVMRLENDTADKSTANADVAITHSVKSRAISVDQEQTSTLTFTLRHLWAEVKARTAGAITTKTFKNLASTGTTQAVPGALTMINSGYAMAIDKLDMNIEDCWNFQVEFSSATVDVEMEVYGFLYELGMRGTPRGL